MNCGVFVFLCSKGHGLLCIALVYFNSHCCPLPYLYLYYGMVDYVVVLIGILTTLAVKQY